MPAQPFRLTSLARLLLGASLSFSVLPMALADAKVYHIAPSSLENALNQFGREAGVLISFSSAAASGIQSKGLEGTYDPEQGLQALLEGTGLQARTEGQGAFSLQSASTSRKAIYTPPSAPSCSYTFQGISNVFAAPRTNPGFQEMPMARIATYGLAAAKAAAKAGSVWYSGKNHCACSAWTINNTPQRCPC